MGAAFDACLVDRVHFYFAPILTGGSVVIGGRGVGDTAGSVRLKNAKYQRIGPDLLLTADVEYPAKRERPAAR